MKEFIVISLLLFVSNISFSQTKSDTSVIVIKPQVSIQLYTLDSKDPYDYEYVSSDSYIVIYGRKYDSTNRVKRICKAVYNGKAYDCEPEKLGLSTEQKKIFNSWNDQWEQERLAKANKLSALTKKLEENERRIAELEGVLNVGKAIKNGMVLMWSWSESGEYIKSQGLDFKIINAAKKKIKYIWITASLLNPVDDLISKKTVTLIGPIEPNNLGSYEFENVFFSNVANKVRISLVKVQYFDGTIKQYTGTQLSSILVDEEDYELYQKEIEKRQQEND